MPDQTQQHHPRYQILNLRHSSGYLLNSHLRMEAEAEFQINDLKTMQHRKTPLEICLQKQCCISLAKSEIKKTHI